MGNEYLQQKEQKNRGASLINANAGNIGQTQAKQLHRPDQFQQKGVSQSVGPTDNRHDQMRLTSENLKNLH